MAREILREEVRIETTLSSEAGAIHGDVMGLYQAILNLVFNARDALEGGGEIEVATHPVDVDTELADKLDLGSGRYVAISVSDSGAGMDAETRARAPEPFFSTKAIGSGFGLGLSTAEAIVREARGALELQSDPSAGTVARLYLPCADR